MPWAEQTFGEEPGSEVLQDNRELLEPLQLCHRSLHGAAWAIADGLLDALRRAAAFDPVPGPAGRAPGFHAPRGAMSEITEYLGLGNYAEWDEGVRQEFLLEEGCSHRLLPANYQPSPETAEVLATCRVVAQAPAASLGSYVISMAVAPSDVLAVQLLLKVRGAADARGAAVRDAG